jgi:hypothetical protein
MFLGEAFAGTTAKANMNAKSRNKPKALRIPASWIGLYDVQFFAVIWFKERGWHRGCYQWSINQKIGV